MVLVSLKCDWREVGRCSPHLRRSMMDVWRVFLYWEDFHNETLLIPVITVYSLVCLIELT